MFFTEELVRSLDTRNLERLVVLDGNMKVLFAQMYGSKGDAPPRDVQKHFAHAVNEFRMLLHRGTSEEELARLRTMAADGYKLRIGECDKFATTGRCRYGSRCLYWHVGAGGGKVRDVEQRVRGGYGLECRTGQRLRQGGAPGTVRSPLRVARQAGS